MELALRAREGKVWSYSRLVFDPLRKREGNLGPHSEKMWSSQPANTLTLNTNKATWTQLASRMQLDTLGQKRCTIQNGEGSGCEERASGLKPTSESSHKSVLLSNSVASSKSPCSSGPQVKYLWLCQRLHPPSEPTMIGSPALSVLKSHKIVQNLLAVNHGDFCLLWPLYLSSKILWLSWG